MRFYLTIIFVTVIILGALICSIRFAFYEGIIRLNYPSFNEFPIHGIDISHHQGEIDRTKLDKKYVQFVFIKATEGKDFKDKRFSENLKNVQNHQIPAGAYKKLLQVSVH